MKSHEAVNEVVEIFYCAIKQRIDAFAEDELSPAKAVSICISHVIANSFFMAYKKDAPHEEIARLMMKSYSTTVVDMVKAYVDKENNP